MSEFFSRNMPTDIWDEILQRHWTFLETEDGMQKIEERKKLEGFLKEFLCIVPHDRKFFLPETAHVLKKSIRELDDFSAYKAMIGFESISQYANNLFTKPWRKEFKVIKMYSGFYQHEIKSNLVDAEKLFKAMGYRQLPNQLLVLDGPICPDQVTNVSRDGMAAYVECQIMRHILNGLSALQIHCTWSEILNFRETHICSQSQAVKSMVYAIQEKRYRKENNNHENVYSTVQPPVAQQQTTLNQSNCPTCLTTTARNSRQSFHQPQLLNGGSNSSINPCQLHGLNNGLSMLQSQQQQQQIMCSMHNKSQQQPLSNNIYNVPIPMNNCNHHNYAQMSHSKSLEHYQEPVQHPINFMRHSFDHYDCVDGSGFSGVVRGDNIQQHNHQNCNFNMYNQHPYNVSGNRYPLPYQISNQLNNQGMGGCNGGQYPSNMLNNYHGGQHKLPINESQIYNEYQCVDGSKSSVPDTNCVLHSSRNGTSNNYLPIISPNIVRTGYSAPVATSNELLDFYNKNIVDDGTFDDLDETTDTPPIKQNSHDKYSAGGTTNHNTNILEQCQKIYYNNSRQLKNTSIMRGNCGSAAEHSLLIDHHVGGGGGISSSNDSSSTTTKSTPPPSNNNKNQDGFGSYDSWNFVYKNLEKNGYTKDLGERGDLLVQGLDLDSIKLNGGDKRKSREISANGQTQTITTTATTAAASIQQQPLVQITATISPVTTKTSSQTKEIDQKIILGKSLENNMKSTVTTTTTTNNRKLANAKANGHVSKGVKNREQNGSETINGGSDSNSSATKTSTAQSSRVNKYKQSHKNLNNISNNNSHDTVTTVEKKSNDWSCKFCTFINPETKKICEICCRTKDLNVGGDDSNQKPIA